MNKTFLFVTLLFVTSYCIENKADSMNQIVEELVELNKQVAAPADKINAVVSQIINAATDSNTAFNAFYSGVKRNCDSGRTMINDFVAKLQGDKVAISAGVSESQSNIAKALKNAQGYEADIKKAKESLKNAHKRAAQEQREYERTVQESHSKLIVVKHLRNIINDELVNAQQRKSQGKGKKAMLLQVQTVTEKLTELKGLLEKSNDNMFAVVVSSLLQTVTEDNFSDQGTLHKILNAVRKISENVKAWQKKAADSNKSLRATHKKQMDSQLASLRALGKLLVEARSDKTNNERNIQELNGHTLVLENALKRKQRELQFFGNVCQSHDQVAKQWNEMYANGSAKLKTLSSKILNLA